MLERLPAPPMPPWLAEMVPFERYLVDVGGARMHVMETGSGLPVVLLHGNPTWGFLYRRVARELRREPMRLIMPDLVGLGFSDKPPTEAHSLDRHIGWMARLFDALGLERAIVALQDWGGPIGAGALAAGASAVGAPARPARQLGLVVMNTVLTPPRPGFRPSAFHRFARMPYVSEAAFRGLGFPQSLMGRFVQLAKLSRDERRAYRYPLRRLADNAAPLALARMVPDSPDHASIPALERCRDFVARFDGPAAIVWGDRDPVLGGARSWMQKLFPRAPLIRTRAGHFLQEEVPATIAGAIRAVAAELPA